MKDLHPSILALKRHRGEKRQTISELADQLHVTQATIVRILNGSIPPSVEILRKVNALLPAPMLSPAPTAPLKCPFMNSATVKCAVRLKRSGCRILEAVVGALLIYLLGLNR